MPVSGTSAPAPAKYRVNEFEIFVLSSIAKCCKVRNQTYIPEQQRNSGVCRNCEDVPDKRRTKLRPDAHYVRVREKPIGSKPWTTCVDERKDGGVCDGKKCHRLRKTVDRSSPLLIKK